MLLMPPSLILLARLMLAIHDVPDTFSVHRVSVSVKERVEVHELFLIFRNDTA